MGNDASGTGGVSPGTRDPNTRREVQTVTAEALGWYGSIFLWLLFTGIGVPPCPEEAGIIYAAGVTALHPDVKWWLAWPATGAGIVAADKVHGHGLKILLTARLLPPLRTGVFIIAGAIHYPFTRFLIADCAYAVVGVGIFFFGSAWAIELLKYVGHWLIYVAAVLLGIYLLYHYYKHLRKRELRGTAEPPVSVLEVPVQNPAADQPVS